MPKTKSSKRWMQRHVNDEYVQRAQREGYRSRAAYKLDEVQRQFRILSPGQRVADLHRERAGPRFNLGRCHHARESTEVRLLGRVRRRKLAADVPEHVAGPRRRPRPANALSGAGFPGYDR